MGYLVDEAGRLWERCEDAWADWLGANGYVVFVTARARGNAPRTAAPMIRAGGRLLRAPDIHTTRQKLTEYWEVKTRARPDVDELTGEREHWMDFAAFADYLAVAEATSARVWIILYEVPTAVSNGRWLRIEARSLRDSGRRGRKVGHDGALVEAWVWPVASMTVTEGPRITQPRCASLLPEEGAGESIPYFGYDLVVRRGRRRPNEGDSPAETQQATAAETVLDHTPAVGLDFLRRVLGLSALPSYSVLAIAPNPEQIQDLIALLDYGVRVFVVSDHLPETIREGVLVDAYREARLLEWAVVSEPVGPPTWVVDGQVPPEAREQVYQALELADKAGGLSAQQFKVVHAPPDDDVMIVAGAGTGKTETMAERLVFLLATSSLWPDPEAKTPRKALRADQVALVTFTRDAASQMRSRIARTLMLRQRLASRCVLPVLAWLMQFSGAEVATIHSFAKRTASRTGGVVGVSPDFDVSNLTMTWHRLVDEALSPVLEELFVQHGDKIPAAYEWERHVQALWTALEGNGVDLLRFTDPDAPVNVRWGDTPKGGLSRDVVTAMQRTLMAVAGNLRMQCLAQQKIPTDQLVPLAIAGLQGSPPAKETLRYLFVDEFQDTDAKQMELLAAIRRRLGAKMFLVGDPKQGIYRFRGAAGDAFSQFRKVWDQAANPPFKEFSLTRNYRSGEKLLDSLHPHFKGWGEEGLLEYTSRDKLLPRSVGRDASAPVTMVQVRRDQEASAAAEQAILWRRGNPAASIGILCRQNWQAQEVQRAIRERGGHCDIRVRGDFFRTEAVREARVLLEAVAAPFDEAALLELAQTRWASGILRGEAPMGLDSTWGDTPITVKSWSARLGTLRESRTMTRDDLAPLRNRVIALGQGLRSMPTIAWIVECHRVFAPATFARTTSDDQTERVRYQRCFDQLITLMDAQFENAPASLDSVLMWLRLQIGTNYQQDEDVESQDAAGQTVALTVHKAKGTEFDHVLIPWTTTPFERRTYVSRVAVLHDHEGAPPRLVWHWRPSGGDFTNVSSTHARVWLQDQEETTQEETRLLYVAMTRARMRLLLQVPARSQSSDENWAGLLVRGA